MDNEIDFIIFLISRMPQITHKYTPSGKVFAACRRCLQVGHTVASCTTPDEECECAYCHEIGHTKFRCPLAMAQHQKRKTEIAFVRLFEKYKTSPDALNDLKKENEGFSDWMKENVKEYELPEQKNPESPIEEDSPEGDKFECEHCGKIGENLDEMVDHEMCCSKKKKKARKKKKEETTPWSNVGGKTNSRVVLDIRAEMSSETKQRAHMPKVRKKDMKLMCL